MQNEQPLLMHLIERPHRRKETNQPRHNYAEEDNSSEQATSSKPVCKGQYERECQSTKGRYNCSDNIIRWGICTYPARLRKGLSQV